MALDSVRQMQDRARRSRSDEASADHLCALSCQPPTFPKMRQGRSTSRTTLLQLAPRARARYPAPVEAWVRGNDHAAGHQEGLFGLAGRRRRIMAAEVGQPAEIGWPRRRQSRPVPTTTEDPSEHRQIRAPPVLFTIAKAA
jgi:hypothetical protein